MDSRGYVSVAVTPKANRKKTSFVWDFFTVSPQDVRKAICNNCGSEIIRGKDPRSFGTTSLASHIKYCHRSSLDSDYVRRMKRKRPSAAFKSPGEPPEHEGLGPTNRDAATYVFPTEDSDRSDVICSRRMDLVHSGHLMNVLYQQHKSGKFCDLTLISAPIIDVSPTIEMSDPNLLTTGRKGNRKEFLAHSSILAAVSAKMKTPIEMGSRTIELKDVTAFGLKSLLEIIYTGKLKRKKPLRFMEAHQIWKAASDLGVRYVHDYLASEHPQVAKWIADEEKRPPVPRDDSFVYEITEDVSNDLVDLCGSQEPINEKDEQECTIFEEAESPKPEVKPEEEANHVDQDQMTYDEYPNEQQETQSNGETRQDPVVKTDSGVVEITFGKD